MRILTEVFCEIFKLFQLEVGSKFLSIHYYLLYLRNTGILSEFRSQSQTQKKQEGFSQTSCGKASVSTFEVMSQ
jgi:hypothetical protein